MTTAELLDRLVQMLTENTEKPPIHWVKTLGGVITYEPGGNESNWQVNPAGAAEDVTAAKLAISLIRDQHPFVLDGHEGPKILRGNQLP